MNGNRRLRRSLPTVFYNGVLGDGCLGRTPSPRPLFPPTERKVLCAVDESEGATGLFGWRGIAAFPAVVGRADESKVTLDEHLFHHLEPWICVEQFDQGAGALAERTENII